MCSLLLRRRRTSSGPMWIRSAPADDVVVQTMLQAGQGRWSGAECVGWYAATRDGRIHLRHFFAGRRAKAPTPTPAESAEMKDRVGGSSASSPNDFAAAYGGITGGLGQVVARPVMPASAMPMEMPTARGRWLKRLWGGSRPMPSIHSLFCQAKIAELVELWTSCLPQPPGLWRWRILENLRGVLLWALRSQTLPGTTCNQRQI